METTCKTAVAAAVAGGYVLGRTKKAKFALGLVMFFAGKQLKLSPADLAAAGVRQLSDNPQLAGLRDQVRDELLTAVKAAASSTMDRGVSSLTGTLRERTGALSGLGAAAEGTDEQEDDEARDEDEEPEEEELEEEEPEEEAPKRGEQRAVHGRRTARSGGTTSRARQTPKKEPAKRAAPKSASKKADSKRQSSSSGSGRAKSGSADRSGSGRRGR